MNFKFEKLNDIINIMKCKREQCNYHAVGYGDWITSVGYVYDSISNEIMLYSRYTKNEYDVTGYFSFKEDGVRASNIHCNNYIDHPIEFRLDDSIESIIDRMEHGEFIYKSIKLFIANNNKLLLSY